jgi:hypothetical protein
LREYTKAHGLGAKTEIAASAVRMSHYSPYHIFFEADCDLSLLVVDELAGRHGFDDARLGIPRLPYGPLAYSGCDNPLRSSRIDAR